MPALLTLIKSMIYSLLIAFIALASLFIFMTTTSSGLYLTVKLAQAFLPGQLKMTQASGQLLDHFEIGSLNYNDKQQSLSINNLSVQWSLKSLLLRQLTIHKLDAEKLVIQRHSQPTTVKTPSLPALPFTIKIEKAQVKTLEVIHDSGVYSLQHLALKTSLLSNQWRLDQLDVEYNNHLMQIQAELQTKPPYAVTGTVVIKPLHSTLQGVSGRFSLGGDAALYHWQGNLTGSGTAVLKGTFKSLEELHTQLQWQKLAWPTIGKLSLSSDAGSIRIDGKLPLLTITIDSRLQAPLASTLKVVAHTTKETFIAKGSIQCAQGLIDLTADYNSTRLPKMESSLNLGSNHLQFSGSPGVGWQVQAAIASPGQLHPGLSGLLSVITLHAQLSNNENASLNLILGKGVYQLPDNSKLPFAGGELTAKILNKQLLAKGHFTIDAQKNANIKVQLPDFQWSKLFKQQQALIAELALNINSLAFLKDLSPALDKPEGKLEAKLRATGRFLKPDIKGTIRLSKGQVTLPDLGISLNPITMTLESRGGQWQMDGLLVNGDKKLALKGKGSFLPHTQTNSNSFITSIHDKPEDALPSRISGTIQLHGQDFPLMQLAEYKINISPDLVFDFTRHPLKITGKLTIPKASIKPNRFSTGVNLSEDVVFKGDKPVNPNPLHLSTDVQIDMGKEVEIAVKGLQGFLQGTLQLRQTLDEPMRGTGELSISEGKYKAYGQDLIIKQGQLLYTNSIIDKPEVNIRAVRQFNNASASFAGSNTLFDFNTANLQAYDFAANTTVGVDVTGHLNAPKIQLFSSPSNLSQADILSMLILGKPANQASKAGGQLLLTAISSMNLDSGTGGLQLLEQLKKSLGFDINLENNLQYNQHTNQNTENTSVVVGKALSSRIYLSYNLGLSQSQSGSNLLTLKYLLNKFFSIQVSASQAAGGLDLLYTHQKD